MATQPTPPPANYAPKNAQRYVEWCRQFIQFHGKRHPRDLGAADVQRFLDHPAGRH
jgi:hypothetical protein